VRRFRRRSGPSGIASLIAALALAGGAWLMLKPSGRTLEGRAQVTDGDTIRIGEARIRLKGIDAPEMEQRCSRSGRSYACGETARRRGSGRFRLRRDRSAPAGRDRYRRVLARCTVNGNDIGTAMVENGWAVSYGRDYDAEEARARSRAAGLWQGEFERPQDWRRRNAAGG
jgi:endonuclease YncB( thermonuclease family)